MLDQGSEILRDKISWEASLSEKTCKVRVPLPFEPWKLSYVLCAGETWKHAIPRVYKEEEEAEMKYDVRSVGGYLPSGACQNSLPTLMRL